MNPYYNDRVIKRSTLNPFVTLAPDTGTLGSKCQIVSYKYARIRYTDVRKGLSAAG